jgi:hypothetical protein
MVVMKVSPSGQDFGRQYDAVVEIPGGALLVELGKIIGFAGIALAPASREG